MRKEVIFFETKHSSKLVNHLKAYEQNFRAVFTSRSLKVEYLDTKYLCSDVQLSHRSLHLIQRLRKEALERMPSLDLKRPEQVKYFSIRKIESGEYFEYDLQAAYVHALDELGICSKKTYLDLLNCPKKERLAVVGSLGTKRFIAEYQAGKVVSESKEVEETEPVWWTICYHVDQVMLDYLHKNEGAGYWVDALWTKRPVQIDRPHRARVVRVLNDGKIVRMDDGRIFTLPSSE